MAGATLNPGLCPLLSQNGGCSDFVFSRWAASSDDIVGMALSEGWNSGGERIHLQACASLNVAV